MRPNKVPGEFLCAAVVVGVGCSSAASAPQGMTLDGTYTSTAHGLTERFTFSNDTKQYSVAVSGAKSFTEQGTYDFAEPVLTLTNTEGKVTTLQLDVLETEALSSAEPQSRSLHLDDSLTAVTGQELVGDSKATSFSVSQCNGGVTIFYTSGSGQSCSLFLSGAVLKIN